ncbi:MAG: hypothetical protein HY809_03355 [Nitrospirae bacterium]|nr:hypothetical protein [Nitrospirota bacterium]
MAFKDIIGQENALNILKGLIAKGRVPHALLFAGEEGIGKKLAAINFAKALNCRGKVKGIDSCGACPSCVKINKLLKPETLITAGEGDDNLKEKIYMSHPDTALILPYKNEIRIKIIRTLEEHLSYKPFEGNYKIAIIDNSDEMNNETSNAFLSTLEAPAAKSIIILVSSKPGILLPTIRSRCQQVFFSPLPLKKMEELLREKVKGLDDEKLFLLSAVSGGRIGYAITEGLIEKRDSLLEKFLLMTGNPGKEIWEEREEMEEWFEWCQLWLRDIAVLKASGGTGLLINRDKREEMEGLASGASLKNIIELSEGLNKIKRVLDRNLNIAITVNHTSMLMRKMLGRQNVRDN